MSCCTSPSAIIAEASDSIVRTFSDPSATMEQTESDLAHAIALMRRHGVLEDTAAYAQAYASDARDALAVFPPSPIKREMLELIDFCVERAY